MDVRGTHLLLPDGSRQPLRLSVTLAKWARSAGGRRTPPAPGMVPNFTSGKPNRASAEAKIISHCRCND
jgi:hypothetical protein